MKYLIEQGTVNKNNICIMGASFGGYSALQSAILEPDMFKCAIGVVGVYDLPLMFKEGDVAGRDSGQRYLQNVLGTDEAHGFYKQEHRTRYYQQVLAFLDQHLTL